MKKLRVESGHNNYFKNQESGYNNYLKPYMKSYDLTTVASVYDKNTQFLTRSDWVAYFLAKTKLFTLNY